jgi:N-acetylmuramoyl-L-alanine amidase
MNLLHRSLVQLFVLAAIVPTVGAVPAEAARPPGQTPAPDRVRLVGEPGSVVRSASYRLGPAELTRVADTRRFRTARLSSTTYRMVALTWRGDDAAALRIRSRSEGRWSHWRKLAPLTDLPDATSREWSGVHGTELLWIGPSDGIQVIVRGPRPEQLALQLIDPGVLDSDADPVAHTRPGTARELRRGAPRPDLLYRKQWGADESWRNGGPYYGRTIQQVHIHHTATGNDYTRADVPALIRGIYRYHTHDLGWSDIGYNFLVDKFGRSWVGRAGGAARIVRGAHTLGFNHTSTGISVIGNYEEARLRERVMTAIVRIAAWKLDRFHRQPTGFIKVYSHGSDKYPEGETVRLRVIDGHRDTNDTACPGAHLYSELRKIRNHTQWRVDNW